MRCFVDLDGVLCDFVGAAGRLHKVATDPYPAPGSWDICAAFGLEPQAFWGALDESFWSELPWTKEGPDILAALINRFRVPNICPITSPSLAPSSLAGKYRWIRRNLPAFQRQFLIGPPKHFCAWRGAMLVDDSDKNVQEFRAAGGIAILLPRPWNSRHTDAHASRECLLADLRKLDYLTSFHDH